MTMSRDQSIFEILQKSFSISGEQPKYSARPGQIKCKYLPTLKGAGKELSLGKDTRSRGFQSILENILKVNENMEEVEILSIWSNQLARIGKES